MNEAFIECANSWSTEAMEFRKRRGVLPHSSLPAPDWSLRWDLDSFEAKSFLVIEPSLVESPEVAQPSTGIPMNEHTRNGREERTYTETSGRFWHYFNDKHCDDSM